MREVEVEEGARKGLEEGKGRIGEIFEREACEGEGDARKILGIRDGVFEVNGE